MAMRQTSLAPNAIEKFGALVRCEPDIGIGQLAATFRFMENQYFKGDDFIRLCRKNPILSLY